MEIVSYAGGGRGEEEDGRTDGRTDGHIQTEMWSGEWLKKGSDMCDYSIRKQEVSYLDIFPWKSYLKRL